MPAAYIEHRPKSSDQNATTTHYAVVVANGAEVGGNFQTQAKAKDWACSNGYRPVHVARVRHLQDRDKPDHWRVDQC